MRQKCPEIHWGKAPPCGQSACGGEDTEGPAIKIMSKIKIKTERDFANEFRVQEQSKEEALAFREDAETGRPGDAEKKVESNQSWVIREQSAGDGRAGGKNRKTRQE